MDKLELDARMARLERRGSMLKLLILSSAGVGILVSLSSFSSGELAATPMPPPMVITPAPIPADTVESAPAPGLYVSDGNIHGEATMRALDHELSMLKQLRDEGMINEEEWRVKKSKVLAEPLKPGDLRADLGMVKQLRNRQVILDDEQAVLRERLLGIERDPKAPATPSPERDADPGLGTGETRRP